MIYDMIYLLTAIALIPGGSRTVHIYPKNNTQNNRKKQNTQNRTYKTIRIHQIIIIIIHNMKKYPTTLHFTSLASHLA